MDTEVTPQGTDEGLRPEDLEAGDEGIDLGEGAGTETETPELADEETIFIKKSEWETANRRIKDQEAFIGRQSSEISGLRHRAEDSPRQQPTIEDAYMNDPQGVIRAINSEIAKHEESLADDPFNKEAKREVVRLQSMKDDLREHRQLMLERGNRAQSEYTGFDSDLRREWKDWAVRRENLTKFATSNLGYSDEQLSYLTDPLTVGRDAAMKLIKTVNKLYEVENAGKTAEGKLRKPEPPRLERPGVPGGGSKDSAKELTAAIEKAKKSGYEDDWAAVAALKRKSTTGG